MTIKTDRKSLAMALVDAESLSKNHLDLIGDQLSLITLALRGDANQTVKNAIALLEMYVDNMYNLAERLSTEANQIWDVVSKEEE